MAARRRRFGEMEVLETLLLQGARITCKRCGKAITLEQVRAGQVEKEHVHEIELGGPDNPDNCQFSHKGKPCHALVTHGNGATIAGSSRHRIAKATEPDRIEKFQVKKRPLDADLVGLPNGRCRGCGQYSDECACQRPAKRAAFGGRP